MSIEEKSKTYLITHHATASVLTGYVRAVMFSTVHYTVAHTEEKPVRHPNIG